MRRFTPDPALETLTVSNGASGQAQARSVFPVAGAHWRAPAYPCALKVQVSVTETEAQPVEPFRHANGDALSFPTARTAATA